MNQLVLLIVNAFIKTMTKIGRLVLQKNTKHAKKIQIVRYALIPKIYGIVAYIDLSCTPTVIQMNTFSTLISKYNLAQSQKIKGVSTDLDLSCASYIDLQIDLQHTALILVACIDKAIMKRVIDCPICRNMQRKPNQTCV